MTTTKALTVYLDVKGKEVKLPKPLPRQRALFACSDDAGGIQPRAAVMSRPGFPTYSSVSLYF